MGGRRRDESGAVAIMFAFLTVTLFTIAAMSVDLGNALARRTDTQSQADYGAFAAAAQQLETAKAGMVISPAMQNAVVTALNNNQPQDDKSTCWTTKSCVTAVQLTDGNLTNGEIRYCGGVGCGTGYSATVKGLQVIAPHNKVDFGLANVIGVDHTTVHGSALVNVFTAGLRVMPMFAVQGCDYGLQTLADPANGHLTDPVLMLAHNDDTNITRLVSDSQVLHDSTGAVVTSLVHNSTNNTLTFTASKWSDSRYIGFFRADDPAPGLVVKETPGKWWLSTDAAKTNLNTGLGYTSNPSMTVTLNIPDAVAQTQAVWYVRVFDGTDAAGQWSPKDEALGIRVGETVLECAAGSDSGNFGTLKFPRTDVPTGNEIAANIALGLQSPLSPTTHQWAIDYPGLAGTCSNGVNDALTAPNGAVTLVPGVNCVDTDTGLAANVATEGLVQGGTYGNGVLREKTKDGCDPTGGSAERTLPITTNPKINDDVLTCFFTNGTTSIQTIASGSYSGGPVLDPSILSSPRFFYVPVLATQPSGGSDSYSIIDFRAAFLTDETATAASVKGAHTGTPDNGVTVQGQDIKQIKVVFFNSDALPSEGDIPIIDYLGVGTRVIRLID